jgi:hypothetical protein
MTSSRFNAAVEITDLPSELSSYVGTLEGKPPSTFEMAGEQWSIYTAEEVEFTEKDLTPPPSPIESEPDVHQSKILLRSVKSTDLILDQARVIRYAEVCYCSFICVVRHISETHQMTYADVLA